MLQGFAGHLLSETFLETLLTGTPPSQTDQLAYRNLIEWRKRSWSLGPASSLRAMLNAGAEPVAAALGFASPTVTAIRDRTLAATLRDGRRVIALLVAGWGEPLDPLWREAATEAIERRAPWCLLFNGTHLRIVDAGRVFTRRYVEFDVDQTLDDPRTFAAFWTVMNAPSLQELVNASDHHANGVCRSLKAGVLAASTDVLSALTGSTLTTARHLDDAFEQALTIVYRVIFLLFAEARGLVPVWHPVYRESYSLDALRAAVEGLDASPRDPLRRGSNGDPALHPHRGCRDGGPGLGLWDALRAIARLAHAGCSAGDLRVTPFNGRLFAPAHTPLAERRNLDDEAARRAVLALSTRPSIDRGGRERIAYRDLGVEQLGAVYETLLDYRPEVAPASSSTPRPRVELRAGSGTRKATGTFYTPLPIAEYLVRRTLGPLVHGAEPERILHLRIVDPSMGSGAFLVAACRYLATAYEAALIQAGGCHPSDIGERERAAIRRTVAERCLYGVDLNPMAVQLARLSLWLTTLAGDRPLSFLDHRLQVGNSLIGAWLAALGRAPRRQPRRGLNDRGPLLFDELRVRDVLRDVLPVRFSLESIPNDTVEQVREKERALATMNARGSALKAWRRIADLWCASWFAPDQSVPIEAFGALSDGILTGGGALSQPAAAMYLRAAEDAAAAHRFFHWELEYPEVFFTADGTRLANGGFDAVLGNPPWDMIRADTGPGRDEPGRILRFTRDSGIYTAQSDGHANCYQLFAERAVALTRAGGRVGLVLPAGLATDSGSASLRRLLLTRCDVDALVGFENHRAVFPIHRSIRFLLLTASPGRPTQSIGCRFGVDDPADLESVGEEPAAVLPWFNVRLSSPVLEEVSGDEMTIPWFRAPIDLAIAQRAAAVFPPLGSERGWSARFGRELNATEDRQILRAAGMKGLPVVEGKQIEPFAVNLAQSRWSMHERDARNRLRDARYQRPRLAYRDVAGATNQLTLIAAILPAGSVSTHTVFCLRTLLPTRDQHLLCGLFNSFVLNYLVRLRVSTHVTTALVERLPVPTRDHGPRATREIAALAQILSRRRDPVAAARLQARVAALYQLTLEEFDHVLSTFPLVPRRQREAALDLFREDGNAATKTRRHER